MSNFNINQTFIRISSPTICGIKPANLFTLKKTDFSKKLFCQWKNLVQEQGLSISAFETVSNIILVFIYDIKWIKKILSNSYACKYLKSKGYLVPEDEKKTLAKLFFRLKNFKKFPHEIGIFLGYPIEDVVNFEEKQGKFCKYCGYWKSYCNPEEAKKCCEKYKQCSQLCKQWFDEGFSIPQIIKKYKEVTQQVA